MGERIMRYSIGFTVFLAVSATATAEIIDGIVATVDTEPILQSDLLAEAQPALTELRAAVSTMEEFEREADALLRDILEQQIENRILLRQARFIGASVTDTEVEEQLARTRGDLTYDEFRRELEQIGMSVPDLRENIRKRILAGRMAFSRLKDFEREVIVTEQEVQAYYEANRQQFERPEEVNVSQIQLETGPDSAERARARARLETIREELEAGADFADLARAHSDDIFAQDGGNMGWYQRGVLQETLEEAVFAAPEGTLTPIVETPRGLHLMRVNERRQAGLRTPDEVRREIEPSIRERKAHERYDKWMAELRSRSRVRVFY